MKIKRKLSDDVLLFSLINFRHKKRSNATVKSKRDASVLYQKSQINIRETICESPVLLKYVTLIHSTIFQMKILTTIPKAIHLLLHVMTMKQLILKMSHFTKIFLKKSQTTK